MTARTYTFHCSRCSAHYALSTPKRYPLSTPWRCFCGWITPYARIKRPPVWAWIILTLFALAAMELAGAAWVLQECLVP
jgi:hypothetical protein